MAFKMFQKFLTVSLDITCHCKRQTKWALVHTGIWRGSQCPDTNGLMQPMLEDVSMVWDPNEHMCLTSTWMVQQRSTHCLLQGVSPNHKCPAFMAQLQLKNLLSRRTSDNVCMMYSLKQSCWRPPYCRATWAPNPLYIVILLSYCDITECWKFRVFTSWACGHSTLETAQKVNWKWLCCMCN